MGILSRVNGLQSWSQGVLSPFHCGTVLRLNRPREEYSAYTCQWSVGSRSLLTITRNTMTNGRQYGVFRSALSIAISNNIRKCRSFIRGERNRTSSIIHGHRNRLFKHEPEHNNKHKQRIIRITPVKTNARLYEVRGRSTKCQSTRDPATCHRTALERFLPMYGMGWK